MLIRTGESAARGAVTGKAQCSLCCRSLCANLELCIVAAPLWGCAESREWHSHVPMNGEGD